MYGDQNTQRSIPRLRTIKQCEDMGVISQWTLRRLIKERRVPCIKVGNRSLDNIDLLIDLLNKGEL